MKEKISVEKYVKKGSSQTEFDLDWNFGLLLGSFLNDGKIKGTKIKIFTSQPEILEAACNEILDNKVKVAKNFVEFYSAGLARWLEDCELLDWVDSTPETFKLGFVNGYPSVGLENAEKAKEVEAKEIEEKPKKEIGEVEEVEAEEPEEKVEDEEVKTEKESVSEDEETKGKYLGELNVKTCSECGVSNAFGLCNNCLIKIVNSFGSLRNHEEAFRKGLTKKVNPATVKKRMVHFIGLDRRLEPKNLISDHAVEK